MTEHESYGPCGWGGCKREAVCAVEIDDREPNVPLCAEHYREGNRLAVSKTALTEGHR